MGSEGVTAYFQLIQNNLQHIASGNEDTVCREAEQRRREIMQSTVGGTQCRLAIDQAREACDRQGATLQERVVSLEKQLVG